MVKEPLRARIITGRATSSQCCARCIRDARHCERREAIQNLSAETVWIASPHLRKIATQFCRRAPRNDVEKAAPKTKEAELSLRLFIPAF